MAIATAGDNQLHDSTITSQQELAGTYYNKNCHIANGKACDIKYLYYLILQVFLSTTKNCYMVKGNRSRLLWPIKVYSSSLYVLLDIQMCISATCTLALV